MADTAAEFPLAHFSDTHVGYEALHHVRSVSGHNQRAQDIVRAFVAVCDDIRAFDPPLVIHSGDVFDKPRVSNRHLLQVMEKVAELAEIRPDGTRRVVVVISGNHDMPRDAKEYCAIELLRKLPGVYVVTNRYAELDLAGAVAHDGADPVLAGTVVHCLPHDQLKVVDFAEVRPRPDRTSILVSHGVAGGSELFRRLVGREYHIPTDVLARGWAYGAIGHWHKRGPVGVGGVEADTPIWYAGSPENMGFGDLRDEMSGRGYNRVVVRPGQVPLVTPVDLPIRPMFRLPHLDAADLATPEEITEALKERVRSADITGAIVGQVVTGMTRDMWSLVDVAAVRQVAGAALHYEPVPRYTTAEQAQAPADERGLGDLAAILTETVTERVADPAQRERVLGLARGLLGTALAETVPGGDTTPDGSADDVPADDVPADDVPADDVPADGGEAAGLDPEPGQPGDAGTTDEAA